MTRPPLETTGAGLRASLEKALPTRTSGARVLRLADLDVARVNEAANVAPVVAPDVTSADVDDAWRALCDGARSRRARVNGEKLQRTDEIDVDTVVFARGVLVPFGGRALRNAPFDRADEVAPGLAQTLLGGSVVVGGNGTLAVTFPSTHARHAGLHGVIAFSIVGARELGAVVPDAKVAVHSGLGKTVDDVKRALRTALATQRADELKLARTLDAVDAIARASELEGVDDAARAEVRSAAMALEGDLWLRAEATLDEIETLIARWLDEPGVLDEARRRAARALTLRALAVRHGIVVDPALRKSAIAAAAAMAGTDALAVAAELRTKADDQKKLDELLLPFAVLEWLATQKHWT